MNNNSISDAYAKNYIDLPFENILRFYRKKNILQHLSKYQHKKILEVGCGNDPLFIDFNDFDHMTVVEPGRVFYEMALEKANATENILILNNLIENVIKELRSMRFDFIITGGFLHEIDNPEEVLQSIKKICADNTVLYSIVPNVQSFHRLLAFEMGIIENIHQKSGHDQLFDRKSSYNKETFNELLSTNGFKVIDSGSYFVKPFTNDQMHEIIGQNIINKTVLNGLDGMIKYMPEFGAELWNCCKINEPVKIFV